jgi:hypothetical protein
MTDDDIIRQRISGKSVHAIAKTKGISLADVNRALDLFSEATFNDKVRKHTLALELARLDELQEVFYKQALSGDVQSAQLVLKLIERRCIILGLHTPQTAVMQLVAEVPKKTSTDRIEAALNALLEDQRKDGGSDKPN